MLCRAVVCAAVIVAIAGCGSSQAQLAQAELERLDRECAASLEDGRLDALRQKFPLNFSIQNAGVRHLADESYISDAERKELLIFDKLRDRCFDGRTQYIQKYYPNHMFAFENYKIRQKNSLAALYKSEITYGQYFELTQMSVARLYEDVAAVDRFNQQQALEQRKAALSAWGQLQGLQNVPNPSPSYPKTTQTNCYWIGNSLSCTSY